MIPFLGAASLADAFRVKAILRGFRIEQDSIMFARIMFARASPRLIMPDNLILEAGTLTLRAETKDLVQQNFCIMRHSPIKMNIETPIMRQQHMQQHKRFV